MSGIKETCDRETRKIMDLLVVLANMGAMASAFTRWHPPGFVGAKAPKPLKTRREEIGPPPHSPEHVAAVALMRVARRAKRMAKAERMLAAKKERHFAQLQRHWKRVARRDRAAHR
jgi:hypothetical protein